LDCQQLVFIGCDLDLDICPAVMRGNCGLGKDNRLLTTVSPRSVHFHKLSERSIGRFREKQGIYDIYYVLY